MTDEAVVIRTLADALSMLRDAKELTGCGMADDECVNAISAVCRAIRYCTFNVETGTEG